MANTYRTLTADGTYLIETAYRRFDANDYQCTVYAKAPVETTKTGLTISGSTTVMVDSVNGIYVGATITGTGIAASTTVSSIFDETHIVISQAATSTAQGTTFTFAAGSWGGGTISWYTSYDGGINLLSIDGMSGTQVTQTADGQVKCSIDTGTNTTNGTGIYAVLSGSTDALIFVGLSNNN